MKGRAPHAAAGQSHREHRFGKQSGSERKRGGHCRWLGLAGRHDDAASKRCNDRKCEANEIDGGAPLSWRRRNERRDLRNAALRDTHQVPRDRCAIGRRYQGRIRSNVARTPCEPRRKNRLDLTATNGPYRSGRLRALKFCDVLIAQGLECADDNQAAQCEHDRTKCKERAGHYLGHDFDTCPMRAVIDDVHLQIVLQLEGAASISAVEGWPDQFAAWVQTLWPQVRKALNDRNVSQLGG